jgi:hypothetical protein
MRYPLLEKFKDGIFEIMKEYDKNPNLFEEDRKEYLHNIMWELRRSYKEEFDMITDYCLKTDGLNKEDFPWYYNLF